MPHEGIPEVVLFERTAEDWVGLDCWFAFQSELVTDATGARHWAWRRRWGGPRRSIHRSPRINPTHPWGAPC